MSRYARVTGIRRRRATRATARRAARATRPMSASPRGRRHTVARVSKSEHDAIEINPPDDRLDHPGMPVRREEIDPPSRALAEPLREADLGPAGTHVDQWKSKEVAGARFKDDRPPASLARIAPQLRRLPSCRLATRLAREHRG